jgi:hypothetical protein
MDCGTIFYDQAFQFTGGPEGKKLAVVLCEYGKDHLIVKTTTSQVHSVKSNTPGCNAKDEQPNFFIPKGTWFDVPTWIELDEVFEHVSYVHDAKTKDGTLIVQRKKLDLEMMKQIIDCALLSDLIDGFLLDHLRMMRAKM